MNELKQWAITVTLCALVGTIVYIITPEGNIKKSVKVVVSIFFIAALLSPFIKGDKIDINLNLNKKYSSESVTDSKLQDNINKQMLEAAKESTIAEIKSILYSYKIYDGQIEADMDINDKNSIFIKSITIFIDDSENANIEAVKNAIKKEFNLNAEIKQKTEN